MKIVHSKSSQLSKEKREEKKWATMSATEWVWLSECLRSLVSKNEKWHMAVTKNPQLKSVYTFEMNGLVVHLNYECVYEFILENSFIEWI